MGKLPDKKTINKRTDDVPIKIIKVCGGALIKFVLAKHKSHRGDLNFYRALEMRGLLGQIRGEGGGLFVARATLLLLRYQEIIGKVS